MNKSYDKKIVFINIKSIWILSQAFFSSSKLCWRFFIFILSVGLELCILVPVIFKTFYKLLSDFWNRNGHILPTGHWQWYAPSAVISHAWYCMVLYGIAWYCMVLHGIALYCIVLNCIAWYYRVLHGIAWYCKILHGIAWYYKVLHGITRHCMVLHGIAWYCMILHGTLSCTILHYLALYCTIRVC